MVKCLPTVQKPWVQSLGWDDLLEKEMATHSIFLPRKSHGWRNLVGYSSWGRKELDMTKQLNLSAILVPFDSNSFMLCLWAMSFFQKLCPATSSPITVPYHQPIRRESQTTLPIFADKKFPPKL